MSSFIDKIDNVRFKNQDAFYNDSIQFNEKANERSTQISKYLFTITSFIIPLSFFPITNSGFLELMDICGRGFLVAAWTFFILSLIFGVIHISSEINFFFKWATHANSISKVFSRPIDASSEEEAFAKLSEVNKSVAEISTPPTNGFQLYLYLQEFSLICGIAMLGAVLARVLF